MRTRILESPAPEEARDCLADAEGAILTVYGRCEVDYRGRAESYLAPGDRLLVLKPDGTLLVHTDEQRTPVNWQPPGCEHDSQVDDGRLVVHSARTNPAERVTVTFDRVDAVVAYRAADDSELELSGSESDLRAQIREDPALIKAGLDVEAVEASTGAGSADLRCVDDEGRTVVVELKRRRVGPDAVGQLSRYVSAVAASDGAAVRGVLVAPSLTDSGRDLIAAEGLEFVSLEP